MAKLNTEIKILDLDEAKELMKQAEDEIKKLKSQVERLKYQINYIGEQLEFSPRSDLSELAKGIIAELEDV